MIYSGKDSVISVKIVSHLSTLIITIVTRIIVPSPDYLIFAADWLWSAITNKTPVFNRPTIAYGITRTAGELISLVAS